MPISYTTDQNNELFLIRFTLSQIASDLRFAIRITNRNRSQIARFGALSHPLNKMPKVLVLMSTDVFV